MEVFARQLEIPISIDSTKAEVARLALDAGASIINDTSALTADPLNAEEHPCREDVPPPSW